jgi:hypothetical protein
MIYNEAEKIYQELCDDLQCAEFVGTSEIEAVRKWAKKHGKENIKLCIKTLCNNIDKTKEHYMLILKMAGLGVE